MNALSTTTNISLLPLSHYHILSSHILSTFPHRSLIVSLETLKKTAETSMGTEISESDLENIQSLCDQVVALSGSRLH